MGIFELIKQNLDKILILIGILAVVFFPKIKEALAAQNGSSTNSKPQSSSKDCCCCDPAEPDHDDADKSQWVVRTMETRAYCVDHRLDEGVKLCEELVGVLVASKPSKQVAVIVKKGTK